MRNLSLKQRMLMRPWLRSLWRFCSRVLCWRRKTWKNHHRFRRKALRMCRYLRKSRRNKIEPTVTIREEEEQMIEEYRMTDRSTW